MRGLIYRVSGGVVVFVAALIQIALSVGQSISFESYLPQPKRVLIVGDSSIEGPLGAELERMLNDFDSVEVMRFGRNSTGLARPDFFDWQEKLDELTDEFEPDLLIGYFGDNDVQGLSTKKPLKWIAYFGDDKWDHEYSRRVSNFVSTVKQNGAHAVLIGRPIMSDPDYNKRIRHLDQVAEEATLASGGFYLETMSMTTNENGGYTNWAQYDGKQRFIRQEDGIHLSMIGSTYLASRIVDELKEHFRFYRPGEAPMIELTNDFFTTEPFIGPVSDAPLQERTLY